MALQYTKHIYPSLYEPLFRPNNQVNNEKLESLANFSMFPFVNFCPRLFPLQCIFIFICLIFDEIRVYVGSVRVVFNISVMLDINVFGIQ